MEQEIANNVSLGRKGFGAKMKYSTQFKRVIEMADCLGQYEMGWLDCPDNVVGRTNFYRELDKDIADRIGVSPNCHNEFYLAKQEKLEKAQAALYRLGNRLSNQGAIDFINC